MSVQEENKLNGLKKASLLLVALGTNTSAQVLKHLSEKEIEKLSAEIVRLQNVDPEVTQAILQEYARDQHSATALAGKEFASQVLEQVVGPEKTKHLLQRATGWQGNRPFDLLCDAEVTSIVHMLRNEHPQVIALVLVNLPREKAAEVLSEFPQESRGEIARAICGMEQVDPEVLEAIEEVLNARLASLTEQSLASSGPKTLVEILNNSERSTERIVLEALQQGEPSLGEQVRKMMFVFEDLTRLEDRSVQQLLREVDQEDLRLALKGAGDEIKELVFRNMSERAAETLKEDLELAGSAKTRDIEAAQQRIAAVVRRLLSTGTISLANEEEEAA